MSASYLDEIMEQPGVLARLAAGLPDPVARALAEVRLGILSADYDRVVLTGMGSSLHGAYPLYLQLVPSLGLPVIEVDTSELVQQAPETIGRRSLLIAISQSGESGEIIDLTRRAMPGPATAIAVTNLPQNTLAAWADVRLASNAGPEQTVSSKSYTGGLACLHLLGAALVGADLARAGAELALAATACEKFLADWERSIEGIVGFLDPATPLVFVGRGRSLASSRLAGLLTQEAAKLQSTALSGGQFRHGPIELVRSGFGMVIFLGDRKTREIDDALIAKVLGLGGRIVSVAPASSAPPPQEGLLVVRYDDVPVALNPILEAVFVQLLQIPLAKARGYTAGAFLNATKITAVI